MPRFVILAVLLALALSSVAQVTVTNQGYATTSGIAVPAIPVSPPILYAPIVRLDQGQTQPIEATATNTGVFPVPAVVVPAVPAAAQPSETTSQEQSQPFNFGIAKIDINVIEGGTGQDTDGKSLAEAAREQRQKPNGTNARTYTNTDIEKLAQTGSLSGAATPNTKKPDNWSPNNGVINPNGQPANAIGAPSQNPAPQTGTPAPSVPKSQNTSPNQPDSTPQAEVQPASERGVEMAQNNEQNAPLAQNDQTAPTPQTSTQPAANPQSHAQDNPATGQLPSSASRLPLIGVLGLFTVCAGIFVRYQRARSK